MDKLQKELSVHDESHDDIMESEESHEPEDKMVRVKLHIPVEQYGYVEILLGGKNLTASDIKNIYEKTANEFENRKNKSDIE